MEEINKPETEQDGKQAGDLRRLRARHQSLAFMAQTQAWLQSQNNTPATTASTSADKAATPR